MKLKLYIVCGLLYVYTITKTWHMEVANSCNGFFFVLFFFSVSEGYT